MDIHAIRTKTVISKTVLDCINSINAFSQCGTIHPIWEPGHCGVRGDKRAKSLAVRAREIQSINIENAKTFGTTYPELKIWARNAHNTLWNSATVGRTSKILWGNPNEEKTKSFLGLKNTQISKTVDILTAAFGPTSTVR